MMKIKELPPLDINHKDWYRRKDWLKIQNEPLLEYVCEVANEFLPICDEAPISRAPYFFARRCYESKLTLEERYNWRKEVGYIAAISLEEYKKIYKPDFKNFTIDRFDFYEKDEVQNTLAAFDIDPHKFYYLLLFVYDYTSHLLDGSKSLKKSMADEYKELYTKILDADYLLLKHNNRKSYDTDRVEVLNILKTALKLYAGIYEKAIEQPEDKMFEMLKELNLEIPFSTDRESIQTYKTDEKLAPVYRNLEFFRIFKFFLKDRKADVKRVKNRNIKISTDKELLISRLMYIVGYANKKYYEEWNENGEKNRMLSSFLHKYRNVKNRNAVRGLYIF